MKSTSRITSCAALAAVLLLGTATTAHAQARLVGNGHVSFTGHNGNLRLATFSVVEMPGGGVQGRGIMVEPRTHSVVVFEISSFMFVGDVLAMAGKIVLAQNAPPQYVAGHTCFFGVRDNDAGPDGITGLTPVPPAFGLVTIQQIIALTGPPPAAALLPVLSGDIRTNR